MRKTGFLILMFLMTASVLLAEGGFEVPVSYKLAPTAPGPIEGYMIGGSLCTEEGLNVYLDAASAPETLGYPEVDKIENIRLASPSLVIMDIFLKNGQTHKAHQVLISDEPIVILRDETASGTTKAKERVFKAANFRGIALIEVEAAIPLETSLDDLKDLSREFLQAIETGELERAVDIHNQIGEILDSVQVNPGEEDSSEETASDTTEVEN